MAGAVGSSRRVGERLAAGGSPARSRPCRPTLLAKLRERARSGDVETVRRPRPSELAEAFGSVTATAVDAASRRQRRRRVAGERRPRADQPLPARPHAPPARPADRDQPPLRAPVRRSSSSTSTGRATRNGDAGGGRETVLAIVGAALRDSIRLVDEAFRLEEDAICVLAPNQDTVEGVQMAERLLRHARRARAARGGCRSRSRPASSPVPSTAPTPTACCTRPTRRCGGPARSGSRWASAAASARSLTDSAKSVHNWCKPANSAVAQNACLP